jgi:hypothetical protein
MKRSIDAKQATAEKIGSQQTRSKAKHLRHYNREHEIKNRGIKQAEKGHLERTERTVPDKARTTTTG